MDSAPRLRAAEFFAGIGLVRQALESEGCDVVFANDIDPTKARIYGVNFRGSEFLCRDVRLVSGSDVPDVDIALASFPCTDLSLAGNRQGLDGDHSGTLWEFLRILGEMSDRGPSHVMLENVVGFASSNAGSDLEAAIASLNRLGFACDILVVDAKRFVPQSRPRLFIIGSLDPGTCAPRWLPHDARPKWTRDFVFNHPRLRMRASALPPLPKEGGSLADVVERLPADSPLWWEAARTASFVSSLSEIQSARLDLLARKRRLTWAAAYRRTRNGDPVWEIRPDGIAGCLRTTRGGSSKQALLEAARGRVRVRWMSAREYARLQGAPSIDFGDVSENQARFALGDAVCVPVVSWIARHTVVPWARRVISGAAASYG